MTGVRLGLDVGGTKVDGVLINEHRDILARVRMPSRRGNEGVLATAREVADAVLSEAGASLSNVASVGIGVPGLVQKDTTTVRHVVNLGVEELDLATAFPSLPKQIIAVENDVKAAALGANALQQVGEFSSLGFLNLGTGVAAGVVIDGQLQRGAFGAAGEIGHLSIDPNGPRCKCGQLGCIEAFTGGAAVTARVPGEHEYPVAWVLEHAAAGDPTAIRLRADIALGAAAGVRALILGSDVEHVIIGGGLTALGSALEAVILRQLEEESAGSPFLAALRIPERFSLLPTSLPAAALGAALVGLRTIAPSEGVTRG